MDDLSVADILMSGLRIFNIFASVVGVLVGLDLIFGGRMISLVNKVLNKTFELDKVVAKAFNSLKGRLDKEVTLERALFQTKIRIIVGVLIILTAGILFNLTR
jgi:hypothetical protein